MNTFAGFANDIENDWRNRCNPYLEELLYSCEVFWQIPSPNFINISCLNLCGFSWLKLCRNHWRIYYVNNWRNRGNSYRKISEGNPGTVPNTKSQTKFAQNYDQDCFSSLSRICFTCLTRFSQNFAQD